MKFIKPILIAKNVVEFEIEADASLCNPAGSLHGGFLSAIADDITTFSVIAADDQGRPGSTIDMSITFLKAARLGTRVKAVGRTFKVGRTLAFCDCTFSDISSGEILSHYKQTKFVSGSGTMAKL